MKINNISHSLINGPGVRLVVWFQGCVHNCEGCFSPDTQVIDAGKTVSSKRLAEIIIKELKEYKFDGLTISGGDPLFQAKELKNFLKIIKKEIKKLNIYCWTGYTLEEIEKDKDKKECLSYIDTLICDRFIIKEKYDDDNPHPLKGSKNQRVITIKNGEMKRTDH